MRGTSVATRAPLPRLEKKGDLQRGSMMSDQPGSYSWKCSYYCRSRIALRPQQKRPLKLRQAFSCFPKRESKRDMFFLWIFFLQCIAANPGRQFPTILLSMMVLAGRASDESLIFRIFWFFLGPTTTSIPIVPQLFFCSNFHQPPVAK